MATGEKKWSGQGEPAKQTFEPVPPKDWEAKLISSTAEIAAGNPAKGGIPYVGKVSLECLGSEMKEGGKNRRVFYSAFLSLKPGSDGIVMPDRANGLKGLMRALGDVRDFDVLSKTDEEGNELEYLSPKQVQAYLKEHDGAILKFHSKVQNDATYGKKAIVDYFIEAEEGAVFGEEEESPAEEEVEAEEEEAPPPPPKKAAPAKGKKK